jgi:ABC-2 type transport system permease protein
VLGKTLPYLVLSQASAFLVVIAAMALFGLPMAGNWLALGVVVALFLVGALGTGLLVSTIAPTQQVAFQASMLIAFLPTFMLSGFIFPISSMPVPLQIVTTIVPAKYFLIALRGVVLKGLGLVDLIGPLLALAGIAAAVIGLAAVRLARR